MQENNELFSPEEMLNPFEAIKETDAEGITTQRVDIYYKFIGYIRWDMMEPDFAVIEYDISDDASGEYTYDFRTGKEVTSRDE